MHVIGGPSDKRDRATPRRPTLWSGAFAGQLFETGAKGMVSCCDAAQFPVFPTAHCWEFLARCVIRRVVQLAQSMLTWCGVRRRDQPTGQWEGVAISCHKGLRYPAVMQYNTGVGYGLRAGAARGAAGDSLSLAEGPVVLRVTALGELGHARVRR